MKTFNGNKGNTLRILENEQTDDISEIDENVLGFMFGLSSTRNPLCIALKKTQKVRIEYCRHII